jgi:Mg/Co/Ni transporter MgtE
VRDVVVIMRADRPPRVIGIVAEVPGRRRIFLPITRISGVDTGRVITTGLLNIKRFEQRPGETLVLGELLDRHVSTKDGSVEGTVVDVGIEHTRTGDWLLSKLAVLEGSGRFRRRAQSKVLDWTDVLGLMTESAEQGAETLLASLSDLRPADLAAVLHDLSEKRRSEVALALDDERLADVLEELPEDDQVEILGALAAERAADVLEAMGPDDAADLLAELPTDQAEALLSLMEPDEAAPVRRLLSYSEDTAGGLMTSEPLILGPDTTVAEALAHVRNPDLSPALAAVVYVSRPPLETPTGRFLGMVHIQALLREPPAALVSGMLDRDIDPLRPEQSLAAVTSHLATYNLVAAPVVDNLGRLVGAVTVDDVLDHLLPEDWRESGGDDVEVSDAS